MVSAWGRAATPPRERRAKRAASAIAILVNLRGVLVVVEDLHDSVFPVVHQHCQR
jgi:hypothetical protein